jgi:hypothetical protein
MNEVGGRSMTLLTIGKTALKFYGLLWLTAIGGILGANLAATIGTFSFVTENKSINAQPWTHVGWYGGVALFFVGAMLGKLRFINDTALAGGSSQPAYSSAITEANAATTKHASEADEQSSIPGFIFACGLAGGFLGLLLGGSLLVFAISYAYSPFASHTAVSSVKVVQEQTPVTTIRRPVIQSSHPVTLYLCLTPAILGVLAGAVGGSVVVLKYREDSTSSSGYTEK